MSLFARLKRIVASTQDQQDFSYLKALNNTQLKSLTTGGQSKAEKHAAQQELLKRALEK